MRRNELSPALYCLLFAVLSLALGAFGSCGLARGYGNTYSIRISSPDSDVRCYAIIGSTGDAVGGNCFKD